MNPYRTRISSALLALVFLLLFSFPGFAENGSGDGSGDGAGRETPLTLASSSVPNGSENVDPNVHIVLTFTKNVVHFNVRENNMKCFTVKDSEGNVVPIRVEMGDDQVDPDVKRIVTIVPQTPYKAGETYVLTVRHGLTAKNEENVLERDVYLSFTIADSTRPSSSASGTTPTTAVTTSSAYAQITPRLNDPTTTATTTKPAETTAKTPRTTKPVIQAAGGTTAKAVETSVKEKQTAQTASSTASRSTAAISTTTAVAVTQSANFAGTRTTAAAAAHDAETQPDTVRQTEPETTAEQTAFSDTTASSSGSETAVSAAEASEPASETQKKRSPALVIGILIAFAAAAAAILIIMQTKKKKG